MKCIDEIKSSVPPDLEPRFSKVKQSLVKEKDKTAVTKSWKRLLYALEVETREIAKEGPSRIPTFEWKAIKENKGSLTQEQEKLFKKRGVALIKGVVDSAQIDDWFNELVDFVKENPDTAGYNYPNEASFYNVFWTRPQTEARFHPNIVKLLKTFSKAFYVEDEKNSFIDLDTQVVYGDRIRIRQPGSIADLPLHLDSSSIERWEDDKFRESYREIFEGRWEDWSPWKLDSRQFAQEDLYEFLGDGRSTNSICSSFRTLQGWLSLSDNKSGEGTLRLLPNVKLSIAYILLRPLFWKDPELGNVDDYQIDLTTPKFPGTLPSFGEIMLEDKFFPHLRQAQSVVGIPDVNKGDFVFWHADIPHDVDREHNGPSHSSVFYYALTPLAAANIGTLLDTRKSWLGNVSPIDYRSQLPPGTKEYQGADTGNLKDDDSKRALGLLPFELDGDLNPSQINIRKLANAALDKGEFDFHKFLKERHII